MTTNRTHIPALLTSCVALATFAGCGGGSDHANKAGASVSKAATLQLAIPDVGDVYGAFFARAVEQRSKDL